MALLLPRNCSTTDVARNRKEIIHPRISKHARSTTAARELQQSPKDVIVLNTQDIVGVSSEDGPYRRLVFVLVFFMFMFSDR